MERFRIFFEYSNGMNDDIVLECETIEEIREQVKELLETRNAKYRGSEDLMN